MNHRLQPVTTEDAPFLAALYREVHEPEFAPLSLPPHALAQLLAMQFRAQSAGYAVQFPHAQDQLIVLDGELAGRLMVDRSDAEVLLVDIALLACFRNRGMGTELLGQLIAEAANRGLPLRLNVRFDNPALRLYERQGFVRTGGDGLNFAMEWRPATPAGDGSAGAVAPASPASVEQGFTGPYFLSLAGQSLEAVDQAGTRIALRLEAVEPLYGQTSTADSFSLQFTGPYAPVLTSEWVELTPPGGEPMTLFLVPNGPAHGRMRYEAIFNRAVPL